MRRTAKEQVHNLMRRIARLERLAGYPPANETAENRQGKITHLLNIILNSCPTLTASDRNFVSNMRGLLNRRRGLEPATALTEKQARTLRKIIFRRYRDYKHAVPPLPAGIKFEDEVRRLLKSQPNPNQVRNELIKMSTPLVEAQAAIAEFTDYDEFLIEDVVSSVSYKRTVKDGDDSFIIFSVKHSSEEMPHLVDQEVFVGVRVAPKFFDEEKLKGVISSQFSDGIHDVANDMDTAVYNTRYYENH